MKHEQELSKDFECHNCCAKSNKKSHPLKKVNWVATLVMSAVFGSFGVDRFMMGHIGLGILKLITFGGFGIWWLIDLILIANKHNFKNIEWEI